MEAHKFLSIKELISQQYQYIIPIYQRNYAWGETEIIQLLEDIQEAYENNQGAPYYIGSLTVFSRNDGKLEVIDGQQRLTTLMILLTYLKERNINLSFDYRDESNNALKNIENKVYQHTSIFKGFKIIQQALKKDEYKDWERSELRSFLKNNVRILQLEVPQDTDLNHYFEIMNNRGEQLEKHEVLKARLMNKLKNKDKRELFSLIWDACSDMNIFVLKRFDTNVRTSFFGKNCHKIPSDFEELLECYIKIKRSNDGNVYKTLKSILDDSKVSVEIDRLEITEEKEASFNSIIDFPNFLLHALKIYCNGSEEIQLNDKYLLLMFEERINKRNDILEFIMSLLRCRLLFDRYIIKSREEDSWVLQGLKRYKNKNSYYFKEVNSFGVAFETESECDDSSYGEDLFNSAAQTKIIHLLSMFHVSFRQKIYKNWMFDVLNYIYSQQYEKYKLSSDGYIVFLESLANQYYKERIFIQEWECMGTSIPNYIFNYLDYLLWRDNKQESFKIKDTVILTKKDFYFSNARGSVEHYFAQNRMDKENHIDSDWLDNLGNLCLISNHQNSALSDKSIEEKRARYQSKDLACQSIKQAIMLEQNSWGDKEIEQHYKDMKKILDKESNKFSK